MTTESTQRSHTGGTLLRGAALGAAGLGAAVVVLGALLGGPVAAAGAAVGGLLALVVLGGGTLVVDQVAGRLPAAALLVALLTYVLQVLVLGLVFAGLVRSGALDAGLDRRWLGGALAAVALAWTAVHVRLATTARIPAYDLPPDRPVREAESQVEAGAR